jgi:phosphatidylethanolamine-binding protein (PEBP) family uncharacterized protein
MRRATHALGVTPIFAVLAALALSGCGSSANGSSSVSGPPKVISLTSSAIRAGRLPALYTCDGRNISPPLSWGALPSDVEEVAVFALGSQRSAKGQTLAKIEWAIAGLQPTLRGLRPGEVPHGAFVLRATDGKKHYSICPARGHTESYTFAIYALPRGTRATRALTAGGLLYNLTQTGSTQDQTPAAGALSATYKRR